MKHERPGASRLACTVLYCARAAGAAALATVTLVCCSLSAADQPPGRPHIDTSEIYAASASFVDVDRAVEEAQPGSVVHVPSGTAAWDQPIELQRGIVLEGAGIGQTIIENEQYGAHSALLIDSAEPDQPVRISGFTFRGSGGADTDQSDAIIVLGNTTGLRIDHNEFTDGGAYSIWIHGEAYGDIDHNKFINPAGDAISVSDEGDGNDSWNRPLSLGGAHALYVEHNVFDFTTRGSYAITSDDGARFVFRYNSVTCATPLNVRPVVVYGNYPDGYLKFRGTRSFEIYGNQLQSQYSNEGIYVEGGSGVIFDNTLTGSFGDPILFTDLRSFETVAGEASGPCGYNNCTYPSPDQITGTYVWNNSYTGSTVEPVVSSDGVVPQMIEQGRDYFLEPMPGYEPAADPDPYVPGKLSGN